MPWCFHNLLPVQRLSSKILKIFPTLDDCVGRTCWRMSKVPKITWNSLKGALKGLKQFLTIESPLKVMKNAFYFTVKALIVVKVFKLLFWLFGHVKNDLIRTIISKFVTSRPGEHKFQYTCWLISQEVKTIRHWHLVS